MKNGKRVQRGEPQTAISPPGLYGQAAYLFFFLPFFFLATCFLPKSVMELGVLKVAKTRNWAHFLNFIKFEQ